MTEIQGRKSGNALENSAIANLTLHGIGEPSRALSDGESRVWVSERNLNEILDSIMRPATQNVASSMINITTDDGNESDLQAIAPALAKRGLIGSFFICAGRLGVKHFLDAAGVRELAAMGMRIGSHGMDHISWRGLSNARLENEIRDSKAKLEDVLGRSVEEAACPFGEYDRRSLRMLRECGYKRVYTSDRAGARAGEWRQPRWTIGAGDTAESVLGYVRASAERPWTRNLVMAVKKWR